MCVGNESELKVNVGSVETPQTTPKHPKPPQTTSKPPQTTSKPSQTTFLTPRICFCDSFNIEEEI